MVSLDANLTSDEAEILIRDALPGSERKGGWIAFAETHLRISRPHPSIVDAFAALVPFDITHVGVCYPDRPDVTSIPDAFDAMVAARNGLLVSSDGHILARLVDGRLDVSEDEVNSDHSTFLMHDGATKGLTVASVSLEEFGS